MYFSNPDMDELEMSENLVCKKLQLFEKSSQLCKVFIYASQRLIMGRISYTT